MLNRFIFFILVMLILISVSNCTAIRIRKSPLRDCDKCYRVDIDFEVHTPEDMEELKDYDCIWGGLHINETELTNLDGLSHIKKVIGGVTVSSNKQLVNIDGLSGLTFVGEIQIFDNDQITNIDGLSNLTTVRDRIGVSSNEQLTNIDGLSKVKEVGFPWMLRNVLASVDISDNPQLTNIDGLANITSISGNLKIQDNPKLASIKALSNLTNVGGGIYIEDNVQLSSLEGLSNITAVGSDSEMWGGLIIRGNSKLTTLDGLPRLSTYGKRLRIVSRTHVPDDAMGRAVDSLTMDMIISDNPLLPTCQACRLWEQSRVSKSHVEISGNKPDECGESCGQTGRTQVSDPLTTDAYDSTDPSQCRSWCILPVDGWLLPGLEDKMVLEKLGPPSRKNEIYLEEATGLNKHYWEYKSLGLGIEMTDEDPDFQMSVYLIMIRSQSKIKTPHGIGIGSTREEVEALYGDRSNPDYTDERRVIIGSIYWGTGFYFENNKVSEMLIGVSHGN